MLPGAVLSCCLHQTSLIIYVCVHVYLYSLVPIAIGKLHFDPITLFCRTYSLCIQITNLQQSNGIVKLPRLHLPVL